MSTDDNRDRPVPQTVYLELSDGQSHKFYEVTVNGTEVTIRYGRIGTPGQSSSSTYATAEKAQAEATKKMNEKLRKGYVRPTAGDDVPASIDPPNDELAPEPTASGVSDRIIDLATLPMQVQGGRNVLIFPLQHALAALEIIATCPSPTFTINLDMADDIAYHFDVRSHQGQIVQNTLVAGRWGTEERLPIPPAFASGQPFTLKIAVEEMMVVYLNNQVLSRYAHRLPPTQIASVCIVYPPGNLQVQSVQVFEHTDIEIAAPVGISDEPPENRSLAQGNTTPAQPPSEPSPIHVEPPSSELLNQATHHQAAPPSVAREHLPQANYPLGFTLREVKYSSLNIPLPRSLVCFEMVGTFNDLANSSLTLSLCTGQDFAYRFSFRPNEGYLAQDAYGGEVRSREERIPIPTGLASGQLFHLVVAITARRDIVLYLNNHPFYYTPRYRPSEPMDKLVLNYDASGLHLQMLRVFEPRGADKQMTRRGTASQVSQVDQRPQPSPTVAHTTATSAETTDIPEFLRELPPQFDPLRPFLEANLVPYIKFVATEVGRLNSAGYGGSNWSGDPLEPWQSKIGGHPYLPKGTSYPADCRTGRMMMFLMQVNCADLPIIKNLNLPSQGLLQFYVGLDVAMCELSPEQHRVLYFPEVSKDRNDLVTDFSFLAEPARALEWYEHVYALTFSRQQDVFWNARREWDESFEIPADLFGLHEGFDEWISDYEDRCSLYGKRGRVNKLGGYPELHSTVNETVDDARGRLLLELQHDFNCDDNFYFFIEDHDLANAYFSNIESYFLRT